MILRILLLCLALATPALAVQPDEMLDDPALEARARAISRDGRGPVCQGGVGLTPVEDQGRLSGQARPTPRSW